MDSKLLKKIVTNLENAMDEFNLYRELRKISAFDTALYVVRSSTYTSFVDHGLFADARTVCT